MKLNSLNISRRSFTKTATVAGVGILALGSASCDRKDVDFYIATVTGSLEQLKPFLPNQADMLSKAISIAKSVNDAYQAGKFDTAMSLANNLTSTITDIIMAAGINLSNGVKIIISITNVALSAIAVLIDNARPAAATNRSLSPAEENVRSLASPKRVNAIFEASKP